MSILDSFSLDGKVAIVTGASSGLGVAFAKGLAEAGADVAICARRVDKLEATRKAIEEMGHRVIAVTADVSEPEDCERVVEETVANLGGVDILINNAGIATAVPATHEDPEEFSRVVDINLNGSYYMAQSSDRPPPTFPRRPTAHPRRRSSGSPATSPSSGPAARTSA
jgi:NAD(P)-dependent dehydrogenase (short-subunit alcohol dehydrogenase family)